MFQLHDCHTSKEATDIFTKHFTNKHKWHHALILIGVIYDSAVLSRLQFVDHASIVSSTSNAATLCSKSPKQNRRAAPALSARVRPGGKMLYYGGATSASQGVPGAATAATWPQADVKASVHYATPWGDYVRAAHFAFARAFDPESMATMKANPDTMTAKTLIEKFKSVSNGVTFWGEDKLKMLVGAVEGLPPPENREVVEGFDYARYSDSTGRVYRRRGGKNATTEVGKAIKQWHPEIRVITDWSDAGAPPARVARNLQSSNQYVDALHVVTMLNGVLDKDDNWCGEPENMEEHPGARMHGALGTRLPCNRTAFRHMGLSTGMGRTRGQIRQNRAKHGSPNKHCSARLRNVRAP